MEDQKKNNRYQTMSEKRLVKPGRKSGKKTLALILDFLNVFSAPEPIRYKTMSRLGRMFIDKYSSTKEGRDFLLNGGKKHE